MNGHAIKRSGFWRVVLELGDQAGLRCPTCVRVDKLGRERGTVYWVDDDSPESCPTCGGALASVTARRQEMLPEKYTRKTDADKALHDVIRDRERGDYVPPVDLTVRAYLEDRWLPALGAEDLAPGTVDAYALHVKRIVPHLGDVPLQKLNRNDVARMSAQLAVDVSEATGKPLAAETRKGVLVALHRAMNDAVAAGLLRTNPVTGVKRPRVRRQEMHTWSKAELSTFLRATREDRLGPLFHLLALTGLRRGEALGLKWSDVDFDGGRLSIQRQRVLRGYKVVERPGTKTRKGRPVSIDAGTVAVLRSLSERQLADSDEWGDAWQATGYVFTRENGEPWHPDRTKKLFERAVKAVEVPRIRMHDLRHTWATLALRAGVNPKVVQERLGHANISMTMDTYSHVLPDLQESAAELVASLVELAGEGSEEPS
jgi:integrase